MKYMALIYSSNTAGPQVGSPESAQLFSDYMAVTAKFREDGVMVAGDPLEGVDMATTIRVRGGKTETMDGPFTETKEQLGGYYIFDVETLDEAIKYASMIPSAKFGSIEVRPLVNFDK